MSHYNNDIKAKSYYGCAFEVQDSKRLKKYRKQRDKRGFDDTELWSLDHTTFSFFLVRFKAYRKMKKCGYPANTTPVRWEKILSRIEEALVDIEKNDFFSVAFSKRTKIGLAFLVKYYFHLWD